MSEVSVTATDDVRPALLVARPGRQPVAVEDRWSSDRMLRLRRDRGHDHWIVVAAEASSGTVAADHVVLTLLNIRTPAHSRLWTIAPDGRMVNHSAQPVALERIVDALRLDMTRGPALFGVLMSNVRSFVDQPALRVALEGTFDKGIDPGLDAMMRAVLARITGAVAVLGVLPTRQTLARLDEESLLAFVDQNLVGASPRQPAAIALSFLDEAIACAYDEDLAFELRLRKASALLFAGLPEETTALYQTLAPEVMRRGRISAMIPWAFARLAMGDVAGSLDVLRNGISSCLALAGAGDGGTVSALHADCARLCNQYIEIAKLGETASSEIAALEALGFDRLDGANRLVHTALLSQEPIKHTDVPCLDRRLAAAIAAAVARPLPEPIDSLYWSLMAEIVADHARRLSVDHVVRPVYERVPPRAAAEIDRIINSTAESVRVPARIDPAKQNIALTFSGFVRTFAAASRINQEIETLAKNFNVYVFWYIFDRLGNIRIPPHCPPSLIDYTNGGFLREIERTKWVSHDRASVCLPATEIVMTSRQDDEHYLKTIGIKHPQWQMVHGAFALARDHAERTGTRFAYAARLRLDNLPGQPGALAAAFTRFAQLGAPDLIYVMSRWSLGTYSLSDRLAIGDFETIGTYCRIGDGTNFVDIEATPLWASEVQAPYKDTGGSHESHLGCWLKLHGIRFERLVSLDV